MERKLPKKKKTLKEYNLVNGQRILCTISTHMGSVSIKDSMIYIDNGIVFLLQNSAEGASPRKKSIKDICAKYNVNFRYSWSLGYTDSFLDPQTSDFVPTDFVYECNVFKKGAEYKTANDSKIFVNQYCEDTECIIFENEKGSICKMDDANNLGISFFVPNALVLKNGIDHYQEDFFEMMRFKGNKSKFGKKAAEKLLKRFQANIKGQPVAGIAVDEIKPAQALDDLAPKKPMFKGAGVFHGERAFEPDVAIMIDEVLLDWWGQQPKKAAL